MLLFIIFLFFFNFHKVEAFRQLGFEIKDLHATNFQDFEREADFWTIFGSTLSNRVWPTSENKEMESDFVLFVTHSDELSITNSRAIRVHFFQRLYARLPEHGYVMGSTKLWSSGNFPDGEEMKISIHVSPDWINLSEIVQGKIQPFFSTDLPHPQKKGRVIEGQPNFEYIYFGGIHNASVLFFAVEVFMPVSFGDEVLSKFFGFRELTLHFSDNLQQNIINDEIGCPVGQGFDESFSCSDCAVGCDVCFGTKPSQCLLCSSENLWRGFECNDCHQNCKSCEGPTEHECQGCNFGFYDYQNKTCLETCEWPFRGSAELCIPACRLDEYSWNPNRTCLSTCIPPLVGSTESNGMLVCENPCPDERNFLYPNGSCISICPAPLVAEFHLGVRFCKNPCRSTSDFLFANRSCLKECPSPLRIQSEAITNYCVNPCHSTNLFLYSNGSCLSSCRSPLKTQYEFGVKYCQAPCNSKREYILNDGSCDGDCPSYFIQRVVESIGTYCVTPCESVDHFILKDGSCITHCPSLFEIKREFGVKYCMSPCLADQYYFSQNNSCLDVCPYPLKIESKEGGLRFCNIPCLNEYINQDGDCQKTCEFPDKIIEQGSYKVCILQVSQTLQMNQMKSVIKISNNIGEICGIFSSFINAGDPTSIFMIPLLHMFEAIKFTDIVLPMNVEIILGRVAIQDDLDHSLQILGIVGVMCLVLTAIRIFIKPRSGSKIDEVLSSKWSIFAPVIISVNGQAILYLFLSHNKSFRDLTCLGVILLTILTICKIQQKFGRWRFVTEIYKSEQAHQRWFLMIYVLRLTFVNIIIGSFSKYQAIVIMLVNFGILFYLILSLPIKKTICFIQHIVIEIGLLLYNTLFVILTGVEHQNIDVIGQLMTISFIITRLITTTIIVLKLIQNVYSLYKAYGGDNDISNVNQPGGHIQLRELSQSEESEESENSEPPIIAEVENWAINNQENNYSQDDDFEDNNSIEAEVVI